MRKTRIGGLFVASAGAALLVALPRSDAAPGNVLDEVAPAATAPIKRLEKKLGEKTFVDLKTGAASYVYPITLPPGRNGTAPSLSLVYSSSNPLRGGVAAGWTMPIPMIQRESTTGVLHTTTYYTSSLSGGQRLVPLPDGDEPVPSGSTAYRAKKDDQYIRYQSDGDGDWYAYAPSGMSYDFTTSDHTSGYPDTRWWLSTESDPFGNEINYDYTFIEDANGYLEDQIPASITYGANPNAGLSDYVKVLFTFSDHGCSGSSIPIGAKLTYREGRRAVESPRRLDRIDIYVKNAEGDPWPSQPSRSYALSYDADAASCSGAHAPLRLLTSIVESVTRDGDTITLPATTFQYGPVERSFGSTNGGQFDTSAAQGQIAAGVGGNTTGTGWPSINTMMADMNADGRPDIVKVADGSASV